MSSAALDITLKLQDQVSAELAGVSKKFSSLATDAGASMTKLGASMTDLGGKMTLGVTTPLVDMGVAMVGLASDLGETTSKIGVLFGDSSEDILAWSETAASAFGQSQQSALDAAANFATFGKSAGLTGQDLVSFSTDMTELASDLASFNNTSPEQAIDAIGAALRGESEPLRAYGVLMDDASMRNEALKLGLIATTKDALTPQQKVLAAQSLILAQTTAAQGDFARTSEGLANQQRILKAKLMDTGAELGEKLLPIALQVVEGVSWLVDRFTNLSPTMQNVIMVLGGLFAAAGPVITVLGAIFGAIGPILGAIGGAGGFTALVGGLGTALAVLAGPVGAIALVVAAVAALGVAWARDWGGIREKTMAVVGAVRDKLTEWGQGIRDWWNGVRNETEAGVAANEEHVKSWGERMREGLGNVAARFGEWSEKVRSFVGEVWQKVKDTDWLQLGYDIVYGITYGIIMAGPTIRQAIDDAIQAAINEIKARWGIHSPSRVTAEKIGLPLAQGVALGFKTGLPQVMRAVTNNNYFSVQLAGSGNAGADVMSSVQMLSALYG